MKRFTFNCDAYNVTAYITRNFLTFNYVAFIFLTYSIKKLCHVNSYFIARLVSLIIIINRISYDDVYNSIREKFYSKTISSNCYYERIQFK